MSECVVRMEMPERCCKCDMADGLTCMATGGVYGRKVPKMTWIRRRPDWCPIICQLPEGHGRLVDADMLEDGWIWGHTDRLGECECIERAEFQNAPTIVPAERSETCLD